MSIASKLAPTNKKYFQEQLFTHNAKDLHYVAVLRAGRAIQLPLEAGCSP
jgi:hypothetical protein